MIVKGKDKMLRPYFFHLDNLSGAWYCKTIMGSIDFLLRSQNKDGGWGYRVDGMSCVEPTAAVLFTVSDSTARMRGKDFLLSLQHSDGGWGIAAMDSDSGWMTAWAVRALVTFSDARDAVARGAHWLVITEGTRIEETNDRAVVLQRLKIDSTLHGYPWQLGDASWVHPTALAMLALVQAGRGDDQRVRQGVDYLFNRAAPTGGWNIGNPWMLDKQIPATIQDTAMALLALRSINQAASEPHIAAAIQYLRDAVARAHTAAELAWGILALREWAIDVGDALNRLNALQASDRSWQGNPFITAVAILASKT